ncbi:MAG: MBL fold metallo-hydrolase [Kiloniellaceae bacterium]
MRKGRALKWLGAFIGVMTLAGVTSQVLGQSDAWKQILNNNRILEIQQNGGVRADTGEVKIDFYGHAAFKITSPRGIEMMFDPWRNDPSGYWGIWFPEPFPQPNVDMVLSTHAHFDHDAVYRPQSPMVLDRMSGVFQLGDVKITGVADKHTCVAPGWYKWTNALAEFGAEACPPNNPGHLDNVIFLVETGGMKVVVWGDNRPNPSDFVWNALGDVDIAIIPVDSSQHILSYEESSQIADKLKANIVIPEHYLTVGASITLTTLGTADEWVDQQPNAERTSGPSVSFTADEVRKTTRKVVYFSASHMKS